MSTSPSRVAAAYLGNPDRAPVYDVQVDHGYDQPLAGGTDVMKRLQDQLLVEQGREPRPGNPKLAGGGDSLINVVVGERVEIIARRPFERHFIPHIIEMAGELSKDTRSFALSLRRMVEESGSSVILGDVQLPNWGGVLVGGDHQGAYLEVAGRITREGPGPFPMPDSFWETVRMAARQHGFKIVRL